MQIVMEDGGWPFGGGGNIFSAERARRTATRIWWTGSGPVYRAACGVELGQQDGAAHGYMRESVR